MGFLNDLNRQKVEQPPIDTDIVDNPTYDEMVGNAEQDVRSDVAQYIGNTPIVTMLTMVNAQLDEAIEKAEALRNMLQQ